MVGVDMKLALRNVWLLRVVAGASVAHASKGIGAAAAPPHKCEIRQSAWCIFQGAAEVTDRFVQHTDYNHVWIVRGFFHPQTPLVVMEPNGCREERSDVLESLSYENGVKWQAKLWIRIRVRLKSDKSCDLEVLVPTFKSDPTGEAYFQGLALIQNCTDDICNGQSLAGIRGQYEKRWRAGQ